MIGEAKQRRRRVALSILWGLFFFVCSLYWTFPWDRVGGLIAERIQGLAPSVEVQLLGFRPSWITGVRLDRVVLRSRELNGAPILGVQDVSARLSVLGLLTGKLKGSAGGDLLGGRLDADAALARTGGKRVAVKARDLDLGRLTYLKDRFDTRLEGKIGADIDLDLLDPQPKNWSGGGTLDLTGLKLLEVVAAGYPVPPLSFETVHAELDVKDGKAVVKRTRVKGAEIDEARLSGDIALSQQIGMSTLNLVAKLRPNQALEEQWGSMFSNFLRKKDADGFYSLYLRGPLSAPKISK